MRFLAGRLALLLCVSCGAGHGEMSAEGAWAEGEPIRFSERAFALHAKDGRVEVRASSGGRPRFLGLRLAYDPRRLVGPGTYQVDPAPNGWLELYCLRPDESGEGVTLRIVEYEVSSAQVRIERVPTPQVHILEGTLDQVQLLRAGVPILTLTAGRFRAEIP